MSSFDPSHQAFESAKKKLKDSLKDDALFKKLSTGSIDEVWKTVKELQQKPYVEQRMRHMGKIGGFLSKLEAYAATIDTFVQVKPDILALIWGPIRILLVWTKNIAQFSDAVCDVMEKVGDALPQFLEVVKIFKDSEKLKEALGLFYGDILDFYVIVLEFFNLSRPKILSASIWPKRMEKINVVVKNLERHTSLLRNEVTLQHIRAEYEDRIKALEHFDQTTEFQQLQKFEALKAQISPRTYYHRLDWLLNRSCNGSAKWLIDDKIFSGWLDIAVSTTPLLWLHGIPGAGKTFLAAAALEEIRARHNVLFVFASHMYQSSTTARSILQSLIFQLASENKDAQSVLVESNARDLAGSTKYVSDLLKTLLTSFGPTYIVIDGLDEIEAVERRILLQQLVDLASCPATRVLLSSRSEDDIANILKTKATGIRVDKRNSDSIRTYIQQRFHDWMREGDFDQEAQDQIERFLAPIAICANGMFLYARIVFDNAEQLTSIQEIEQELTVLPLNLNDAYGRIFSRINESQPALRRKARTILGWIGCAPVPMTRYEMEQALLIDSNSNASPSVIASVNFVRICGPILEVVDEIPQFVHFTVKEYIFSQNVEEFIKVADANCELTMSILNYLSSDIFNVDNSEEQLKEDILAGRYRLQSFASSQWISLATRCAKELKIDTSAHVDLSALLTRFTQKRKNDKFEGERDSLDITYQAIEWGDSSVSDMIGGILQFRQDDRQTDWTYDNDSRWVNLDPSTLSTMSTYVFTQLEKLACAGRKHEVECHCEVLRKHYGTNIFKCIFPSCDLSRRGFKTREAREDHVNHHSRPWKCATPSCPYADIGFKTSLDMYNHRDKEHPDSMSSSPVNLPLSGFSYHDMALVVFELTNAQRVDQLKQVVSYIVPKYFNDTVLWNARQLAVNMGSLQMVKILTPSIDDYIFSRYNNHSCQFFKNIVRGGNVAIFRWLLDALCLGSCDTFGILAGEVFRTNSDDLFTEWEDFLIDSRRMVKEDIENSSRPYHPDAFQEAKTLIPQHNKRFILFSEVAFYATQKSAVYEERLIQTWHRLIASLGASELNPRFLGWSLTRLGKSSKSIRLATELLRLGAPIDFPRGNAGKIPNTVRYEPGRKIRERPEWKRKKRVHRDRTTLHHATRATSESAAQFVRFLLEQGADINYGYAGKKPENEEGPKLMQKWLGETWEELVERTRPARLERMRREGNDDNEDDEGEEEENDDDKGVKEPKAKRRRRTKQQRRGRRVNDSSDEEEDG